MKVLTQINDPIYNKKDTYTALDRFFLKLIRDERDLPFVYLSLQISLTMLPLGILLFFPFITGWLWWMIAIVYLLINNFYYKGSFGLMLHCTCHNKLYKKNYDWLNKYLPWVMGLFFGQTPDTYFSHHIGMHHPENNLPEDKSSTMYYQRDSFRSFLAYFSNFFFVGIIQLSEYFLKKNRKRLLVNTLRGEIFFFLFCALLCAFNWPATLVVFIIPFLISRFIMMLGNWTQHAFIDPLEPGNPYKNSITCINIKYNQKCWNDGYHISHHIRPNMHWTEHPVFFLKNKSEYAKNRAIVFDGVDFLGVFYYLMTKRYKMLAKNFVNIDNTYRSQEEVIYLLKERTKRIPKKAIA